MYVAIHHTVTDPKKWDEVLKTLEPVIEGGKLPQGLKALFYLPSTDGRRADCFWQADSIEDLKRFLDPYVVGASKDEYFQINAELAFGLPQMTQEPVVAAH